MMNPLLMSKMSAANSACFVAANEILHQSGQTNGQNNSSQQNNSNNNTNLRQRHNSNNPNSNTNATNGSNSSSNNSNNNNLTNASNTNAGNCNESILNNTTGSGSTPQTSNNRTNNHNSPNSNPNNGSANNSNSLNSPIRTFSPPSPYSTAMFHRDMRRHCSSMANGSNNSHSAASKLPAYHHECGAHVHYQNNAANLFSAAGLDVSNVAEIHDLTSRNQNNLKPDMSSMYHHHMMQTRQSHAAPDMHDFLGSSDPMAASLPAALGLAATASASDVNNHHSIGSSVGSQLHTSSSIYSSHHHGTMNMNGMISSLHHHHHHSSTSGQLNDHQIQNPFHLHHPNSFVSTGASPHHQLAHVGGGSGSVGTGGMSLGLGDPSLLEADPRGLEVFAERFKQRRIKLGVTQADVGKALANLKLPGVGSLSQSTICRFESLTLSHNNMVALKPILQAWLEAAEAQARKNRIARETTLDICVLPSLDKKRKRTSIAAPEKRSLEAYFSVQPRPSGEKIAAIAEKLDLKKNVVRVWFCNQRQKQKRMKYSAINGPNDHDQ